MSVISGCSKSGGRHRNPRVHRCAFLDPAHARVSAAQRRVRRAAVCFVLPTPTPHRCLSGAPARVLACVPRLLPSPSDSPRPRAWRSAATPPLLPRVPTAHPAASTTTISLTQPRVTTIDRVFLPVVPSFTAYVATEATARFVAMESQQQQSGVMSRVSECAPTGVHVTTMQQRTRVRDAGVVEACVLPTTGACAAQEQKQQCGAILPATIARCAALVACARLLLWCH